MDKRVSNFGTWLLISAGAAGALAVYGCSSDSPASPSTPDDAGQEADTSPATDSGQCVDQPNCTHCIDVLSSRCRGRGNICNCNKPTSSNTIIAALLSCSCSGPCASVCAVACGGQTDPTPACQQCQAQMCSKEGAACAMDIDSFDQTCNMLPGQDAGLTDASDDAADASDGHD